MLQSIAEKYRSEINFATIDAEAFGFFAGTLGLIPGQFPAFVIEDVQTGETVPFDQNEKITREAIGSLVMKYIEERRQSHVGSKVWPDCQSYDVAEVADLSFQDANHDEL
jgi:hypothetical protein